MTESPESAFQRLYTLLDEADSIQSLDAFDAVVWEQLKKQKVVELAATLEVPLLVARIQAHTSAEVQATRERIAARLGDDFVDDDVDTTVWAEMLRWSSCGPPLLASV